jgi:hypothetical protein
MARGKSRQLGPREVAKVANAAFLFSAAPARTGAALAVLAGNPHRLQAAGRTGVNGDEKSEGEAQADKEEDRDHEGKGSIIVFPHRVTVSRPPIPLSALFLHRPNGLRLFLVTFYRNPALYSRAWQARRGPEIAP